MNITVILCTYNRQQSLARALNSIGISTLPAATEWEVLVVDNNSNDATRAVVADFCRRYSGRFRYLFEPRQGKSYALNAGIREAHGDILVFVDDDVIAEPTWLRDLTTPFQEPKCSGAGGRILPEPGFSPPRWLALDGPNGMAGIFCAQFDLGDRSQVLDLPPYGTNMAFRREMFEKHGYFRTDLGPRPGSDIRNEDTEFGWRLIRAGERLVYVPSAVVYHEVPKNRIKKEYFLKWWFAFGRARIREAGIRPDILGIRRHYFSIPNNMVRVLVPRVIRWWTSVNPQQRFYCKCMVWSVAGRIVEMFSHLTPWQTQSDLAGNKAKL
jgi:glycosyltransferase involved in cell wall biosynthesis